MGLLLQRAREMNAKNYWKPETAGEGIEGTVVAIKKDAGKFHSTEYVIQDEHGQRRIISVPENSVLAQKIAEDPPLLGDGMAVLYLGVPDGKKYKNWRVVVEHRKAASANGDGERGGSDDVPF